MPPVLLQVPQLLEPLVLHYREFPSPNQQVVLLQE
jgi:hypothetical protein